VGLELGGGGGRKCFTVLNEVKVEGGSEVGQPKRVGGGEKACLLRPG